ncbi:transposase [Streptomyces tauricus]|uniref:Transposase n=1 Tax=Streptomyces tauricus TaxID=68274 RepID=A0ABZ1JW99_9ACTN|nr:transposase [Streptomyces tauricus]
MTAVIDSQSVKVAATVPWATSGYDVGKKAPGRKRHLVVDTKGLPPFVMVTPAGTHDSAAAREVLFRLRLMHPEITAVWADRAYAGTLVDWAKSYLHLTIRTVSRSKGAQGFVILPRRWVVERLLAWWLHATPECARLRTRPEHSEPMLTLAVTLMTRRLTRQPVSPNAAKPRPTSSVTA